MVVEEVLCPNHHASHLARPRVENFVTINNIYTLAVDFRDNKTNKMANYLLLLKCHKKKKTHTHPKKIPHKMRFTNLLLSKFNMYLCKCKCFFIAHLKAETQEQLKTDVERFT